MLTEHLLPYAWTREGCKKEEKHSFKSTACFQTNVTEMTIKNGAPLHSNISAERCQGRNPATSSRGSGQL